MLACDQHDFIEIACMYHLKVVLQLKTGAIVTGIAHNISLNNRRDECLQIIKSNKIQENVLLTDISSMSAKTINPHFEVVNFI